MRRHGDLPGAKVLKLVLPCRAQVPRAAPQPVREVMRAVLPLGPDHGGFLVMVREGLGSAWRLR